MWPTAPNIGYRDLSPKQIVPKLADQGTYIGSESIFYRVLKEQSMLNIANHQNQPRIKSPMNMRQKGLVRCGAGISPTYTHLCVACFYLYMIVDVWRRKIIAATVFDVESMELSDMLNTNACSTHNVKPDSLVLHSDNGGPMKGSTMLVTLQNLGVVPSFSRPMVSDDNPYSEALFRTMKYRPCYPSKPCENLADAQAWVDEFASWYNTRHLHSAIRFVSPDDRHYGREHSILAKRQLIYNQARLLYPNRWANKSRNWNPILLVSLNPATEKLAA